MTSKTIKSIKGTDANMRCQGFQFEPGKTYSLPEGESVEICKTGFHACPVEHYPLSVFAFYPPGISRYFDVIQSGDMQSEDNKTASQSITFGLELSVADLVQRAVEFAQAQVSAETGNHATSNQGVASAMSNYGVAHATGHRGVACTTGYLSVANATGEQGAANATGYQGVACATGQQGVACAMGRWGVASATGEQGAAMATGIYGRVMGGIDDVSLFAREMILKNGTYKLASVACGITGRDGIKAGVWYVCKNGKLVEVE